MKNISIARKFGILFLLVSGFLVIILGLSVYDLRSQTSSIESIKAEAVIPLSLVGGMVRRIQGVRIDLRDQLLSIEGGDSPQQINKYRNSMEGLRRDVALGFEKLSPFLNDAVKRTAFDAVRENWKNVEKTIVEIDRHLRNGDLSAARSLIFVQCYEQSALLIESIERLQEVAVQAVDRHASEVVEQNDQQIAVLAFVGLAIVILNFVVGLVVYRDISGSIAQAVQAADAIAKGDLTVKVQGKGSDELAHLMRSIDAMAQSLRQTVNVVSLGADQVARSSEKLTESAHELGIASNQQFEEVLKTASAMAQFSSGIAQASTSANEVNRIAALSLGLSDQGSSELEQLMSEIEIANSGVHDIADKVVHFMQSANLISGITLQVKAIANQTNLLALNAAIEAARAGEQGRGFAVVADEVRKLAESSAKFTNEIEQMIADMNEQGMVLNTVVQSGVQALLSSETKADKVIELIRAGHASILDASKGVNAISLNMEEQAKASVSITGTIGRISALVESNNVTTQQTKLEMNSLNIIAAQLRQSVNRFRLD